MRNMIRWQPINRPATFNTGIDRLFNEFMGRSLRQMEEETAACAWTPAVNILEREEGIVISPRLLARAGVPDEAIAAYRATLAENPRATAALQGLAGVLVQNGSSGNNIRHNQIGVVVVVHVESLAESAGS